MGTRYNSENFMMATSLQSSTRMKKRSNRDMMGAVRLMFCWGKAKTQLDSNNTGVDQFVLHCVTLSDLVLSYRPPMGLAAAKMEVRALSVALTPALVMEMVCCSMASWMAVWSRGSILSNSSIQHTPWE